VAFYRRKMLDRLRLDGQYFDEDYFAFNEDLDLGWRAQLQGWQCVYEPGAVAYHQRGATGQTPFLLKGRQFARRSAATRYHIIKNRYMTMLKNDSAESLMADAACIIGYDILLWSYTVLTSPAVVLRLPVMVREILLSLSKRRVIQSSRCVDFRSIREAIA